MKRTVLLVAAIMLAGVPSAAQSPPGAIRDWYRLNAGCRGGAGNAPMTEAACVRRERIATQLNQAGWCYGKREQSSPELRWHRCSARSLWNNQQAN